MANIHTDNLLLIVVGTHLRAESADRPLAYMLQNSISDWIAKHADAAEIDLVPVVCSDLWYLNDDQLQQRPTICIGGPGVNALSAYFAQHLPNDVKSDVEDDPPQVILQLDPEFTDLRTCIWGMDHATTRHGIELFIRDYLPQYLTAVVNQVEPEFD